jgi:hypothetical protein
VTATETAPAPRFSRIDKILWILLAACVARLWLMVMPSSLWVDELVTVFVIRNPNHPSFALAPQVQESIYYWLPKIAWRTLGTSEISLRLPSVLSAIAALYFVARLTARLIDPGARWLALSLCLALVGFDSFAVDARPYALGIAVASAGLFFLVRWLDEGKWLDDLGFILAAALLWRVHLFYWPFYLLFAGYGAVRIFTGTSRVRVIQVLMTVVAVPALLAPVAMKALEINAGARSHVFNAPPGILEFIAEAEFVQIAICAVVALIFRLSSKWKRETQPMDGSSLALILGWWLICPVCLAAYSILTSNGVLILRYTSLMLPGVALTATVCITRLTPPRYWKRAAVIAATVALALLGQWDQRWPSHEGEGWREAADLERRMATDSTPVMVPSPFIEALPPAWSPDYSLPGFLYANLSYYPMRGAASVFPYTESLQSDQAAQQLLRSKLIPSRKFLIFGPLNGVEYLYRWCEQQPELATWHAQAHHFGVVFVVVYSADPLPDN